MSVFVLFLHTFGCTASDDPVGARAEQVVYGDDDRFEVFEHPNAQLREIAKRSIVALIPHHRLQRGPDGTYEIEAKSLGEVKNLCPGERFGEQPTAASCSAVLISPDLVLTAGHCMESQASCEAFAYVFNYSMSSERQLTTIVDDDVYRCARLVVRDQTRGQRTPDFAIIQLDRPVAPPRRPIEVRSGSAALDERESLSMIGFGSGLPSKIDSGGTVADPRAGEVDFFIANTDAFAGHSGSATLDSENRLAGILVAGREPDYVSDQKSACQRVNTFGDNEAGEAVAYVTLAVEALCDSGWPSEPLCGTGACTHEACPPEGWTCNPAWFAAGDSCDCNCGAYDPDCDDAQLLVGGCGENGACDTSGQCEIKANTGGVAACAVAWRQRGADPFRSAWVALFGLLVLRRLRRRTGA
jgi:hypothetical protein